MRQMPGAATPFVRAPRLRVLLPPALFLRVLILQLLIPGALLTRSMAADLEPPEFVFGFGRTGTGLGFLRSPSGVARDARGHFFVVELQGDRVQEFDPQGAAVRAWGAGGSGPGQFAEPQDIAIDPQRRVWISDRLNHRLQWFTTSGEFLGELGPAQGVAFVDPSGLGLEPGGAHLFVSDLALGAIFKLDITGATPELVMRFGEPGTEAGQLIAPTDVAVSTNGEIHVVDFGFNRVQIFSPTGLFRFAFGSSGPFPGNFAGPVGVAVDAHNRIFVVDTFNSRVQVFQRDGRFLLEWGRQGTRRVEFLKEPTRMLLTADGLAVICDADESRQNDRIAVFAFAPTAVQKQSWTQVRSLFRGR